MTETENVPEWAMEKALRPALASQWSGGDPWTVAEVLADAKAPYAATVIAFARYIAAHEESPVDPVVEAAAIGIMHYNRDGTCFNHPSASPSDYERAMAQGAVKELRRQGFELARKDSQ